MRFLIAVGACALTAAGLVLGPIFYYGTPQWPTISDPAGLRREAAILYRGKYLQNEVPRSDWTEQITALHPHRVRTNGETVTVVLASGTSQAWGFEIWPEGVQRPDAGIARFVEHHQPASRELRSITTDHPRRL